MSEESKIAKNLRVFKDAIDLHDKMNPSHSAYGIGMSAFDLERLGLEEGEQILPGITIHVDGKTSGNFRVLCDGEHDDSDEHEEAEDENLVKLIAVGADGPQEIAIPHPDDW